MAVYHVTAANMDTSRIRDGLRYTGWNLTLLRYGRVRCFFGWHKWSPEFTREEWSKESGLQVVQPVEYIQICRWCLEIKGTWTPSRPESAN